MNNTPNYNDPKLIGCFGDAFERQWADKVITTIPSYATIWATYIGNNGRQEMLPMSGADRKAQDNRVALWERLYTLFESFALCWDIEAHFGKREQINGYPDYALTMNLWVAFFANVGRITDMAQDVSSSQFKETISDSKIRVFFARRNIALHGPKVPMWWCEKSLVAPALGNSVNEWNDNKRWADFSPKNVEFISTRIAETLRALESEVEGFLSQVLAQSTSYLGLVPVSWPQSDRFEKVQLSVDVAFADTQSYQQISPPGVAPLPENYGFSGIQ